MHSNKYLLTAVVIGTLFIITACVITPSNQNQHNQFISSANNHNKPNYSSAPVEVSDLNNSSENYAVQQLRTRGFNQVGAKPALSSGLSHSWWLNLNTNQCVQLDIADNKIMSLIPRTLQNCYSTR